MQYFVQIFLFFSFPNLGIQHVTKKNVPSILKERYLKKYRLEKSFNPGASSGDQIMHVDLHDPADSGAIAEAITSKNKENKNNLSLCPLFQPGAGPTINTCQG